MKRWKPSHWFACLSLISAPIFAQNTILAVGDEWEGYTQKDGKGAYWDILQEVYTPHSYTLHFELQPYPRSILSVHKQTADVVVGVWARDVPGLLLPTHKVETDKTSVVYYSSRKLSYTGPSSLEKARVGFMRGYNYNLFMPEIKNFQEVNSAESLYQLLKIGRIDFLLDSSATVDEKIKAKLIPTKDLVVKDEPDLALPLFFAFSNSPKGKLLMEIFNADFLKLVNSGKLKAIYARYGLEDPTTPSK